MSKENGWPKDYVMNFEFLKESIGEAYATSIDLIEGEPSLTHFGCGRKLDGYNDVDEYHKELLKDVSEKLGDLLDRTRGELYRLWALGKSEETTQTNNQ